MQVGYEKMRFSTNISLSLNWYKPGPVKYLTPIRSRMRSIEWCHFQRPWVSLSDLAKYLITRRIRPSSASLPVDVSSIICHAAFEARPAGWWWSKREVVFFAQTDNEWAVFHWQCPMRHCNAASNDHYCKSYGRWKKHSRTGSSWISYMEQVPRMKMFLYAERTGNWTLYLQCVSRMLPYFHAAGHLAYAKSARLYLQQMNSLESNMTETENIQFTENGYFTVQRRDLFWSGNFTDQTIEQDLMRLLKSSGGMTHGRGITDSSLTRWIHAFPQCIPICDTLDSFANIHIQLHLNSTCQLRVISQRRDHNDFATFCSGSRSTRLSRSCSKHVMCLCTSGLKIWLILTF